MRTQANQERHIQEANIIRSQIPTMALWACGARDFTVTHDDNDNSVLRFRVTINKVRLTFIKITLKPNDTYTVELIEVKRKTGGVIVVEKDEEVYCDMLGEIIYHMCNK